MVDLISSGQDEFARAIALVNPRLAYMLLRHYMWVPRTYNFELRWDTIAAETPIDKRLSDRLPQDLWISDFVYTVSAPSYAVGSLWKPMMENQFAELCGSFIKLALTVEGDLSYNITNESTPLGAICSHKAFEGKLLDKAWVVPRYHNLYVRAINTRAFDLVNEIPTIVTLTLCVKEPASCHRYVDHAEAVCYLRKCGILTDCDIVETPKGGR